MTSSVLRIKHIVVAIARVGIDGGFCKVQHWESSCQCNYLPVLASILQVPNDSLTRDRDSVLAKVLSRVQEWEKVIYCLSGEMKAQARVGQYQSTNSKRYQDALRILAMCYSLKRLRDF